MKVLLQVGLVTLFTNLKIPNTSKSPLPPNQLPKTSDTRFLNTYLLLGLLGSVVLVVVDVVLVVVLVVVVVEVVVVVGGVQLSLPYSKNVVLE